MTYDAATHTTSLYLNGEFVKSDTQIEISPADMVNYDGGVDPTSKQKFNNGCYVGRAHWSGAGGNSYSGNPDFRGNIDNFMVYNTNLSRSDIRVVQGYDAPVANPVITVECGEHGSITPTDPSINLGSVASGTDVTFNITPDEGWFIQSISVDGEEVAPFNPLSDTYTFANVTEDHMLNVEFAVYTYVITVNNGENGNIYTRNDLENVEYGSDVTIVVTPNEGYYIQSITVDG